MALRPVDLYPAHMPILVLTVLGHDRAGLVSTLSARMAEHGASWQRSSMAHLAGQFAGIVEVTVDARRVDDLVADLTTLAGEGLRVTVERVENESPGEMPRGLRFALHLVGADRPGIVAEVSRLLAAHEVNVEEINTQVSDAPMAGGTLFEVDAVLSAPSDRGVAGLESALEALADELMVDLALAVDDGD